MSLSSWAADRYVATDVSKFTAAEIRDVPAGYPDAPNWVLTYILNTVLRVDLPSPEREYRFNFLRRASTAFNDYTAGRIATAGFLASQPRNYALYLAALHSWERCLAALWQGYSMLEAMTGVRPFERGGNSVEERINLLYNASKHTDSRIQAGQMPEIGTLPVWLTNDGIRSVSQTLTWTELADTMTMIGNFAHALEDPLDTRHRIETIRASRN